MDPVLQAEAERGKAKSPVALAALGCIGFRL
jgi:hypothetical protein